MNRYFNAGLGVMILSNFLLPFVKDSNFYLFGYLGMIALSAGLVILGSNKELEYLDKEQKKLDEQGKAISATIADDGFTSKRQ